MNSSTSGAAPSSLVCSMPEIPAVRCAQRGTPRKSSGRSTTTDPEPALEVVTRPGADPQDESCPPEVHQLGCTIGRWRHQIAAWHHAQVSNGATEALNNLIKGIKRVAFGFRRFAGYRIRALLYAGKPDWASL